MTRKALRIKDVQKLLAARCKEAGGQSAFARLHGVPVAYVSQVLLGRRPPSERMCEVLGIREDGLRWVIIYKT